MKELWKDIPNYEGLYKVSNFGNIKSLVYKKHRYLKEYKNNRGYMTINIKKKIYKTHRLVAQAFIPNVDNKPQVNHIDGNKQNNNISNLEWCTNSENQIHAVKMGLRNNYIGSKVYNSKPVMQYNLSNKFIKEWDCASTVEREIKISQSQICGCCLKKHGCKTAGGYIWKYKKE